MSEQFYKDFFDKKKVTSKLKYLDQLYKAPKKDKGVNMPHFLPMDPDIVHQADLLHLPTDGGYKYALVVVDVGTGETDAEPVKDKTAKSITDGFEEIYSRKPLDYPKVIQFDSGTEFKGQVKRFFSDNDIGVRYAKPYRHRSQGLVEARNKMIGKALFKRMTAHETLTGQKTRAWMSDLPILIKYLNKKINETKREMPPEKILCEGKSCDILKVGTKVRVMLEVPRDNITGKKLHGKFRASDIRWDTSERTIKEVLLAPHKPPMYLVSSDKPDEEIEKVAFTKNQLQVIHPKEKDPDRSLIRGNPQTYVIKKIVGHRTRNGQRQYKVRWRGYTEADDTWEPRNSLVDDVPQLVRDYDAENP